MSAKQIETKVEGLIAAELTAMGYNLVRVKLMSGGSFMTLQIMAERLDETPMTVEDCVQISHSVSPKLDADVELADQYTLEVSSPGIDRPLVHLKDFERFKGHLARIDLETPLVTSAGTKQKRFQGSIVRINGAEPNAEIEIRTDSGAVCVPASNIARAKLVVVDTPTRVGAAKH
ncbi:MAG: ribosome maturation factor RimP [Pseudomonadota bacterium]|nr:ribosome maturation factor RimP [Pseudomonadota bacterium]